MSLFGIIILFRIRKKEYKNTYKRTIWTSALLFFIVYFIIVFDSTCQEIYYKSQLNKFDLDGNGIFNGLEITADFKEAMKLVISDTGRTFAPFTGIVYAGFLSLVVFLSISVFKKLKMIIKK